MKKLRFLVPVFSFGLILAYAALSQSGDGSLVAVSKVYAHSSKNFSSISNNITFTITSLPNLLLALAGFIFFVIVVPVYLHRLFKRKKTTSLTEEQITEEPSDD
ncbi:MAG: hypothetical protein KA099_09815 [Alphaproteobacteria bacterium]|nr:hypothetical protein [Alphaproteobacteria bacterium]MBP7760160.1 hypothetical protein [Alphaproteobacteria bacterium]MBP7763448.1 hypothetical protein [Alphaproteobacteria bacterium]MBP7905610.1 hypothetical protein [Alphaproteobacteria bacterium]